MDAVRRTVVRYRHVHLPLCLRTARMNSEAYRDRLSGRAGGRPARARSAVGTGHEADDGQGVPAPGRRRGLRRLSWPSSTLESGASYLSVFRVTGTAAFMAYGFIGFQESIWFGLPGKVAFKHALDGLVYALLTAGIFAWLWPV